MIWEKSTRASASRRAGRNWCTGGRSGSNEEEDEDAALPETGGVVVAVVVVVVVLLSVVLAWVAGRCSIYPEVGIDPAGTVSPCVLRSPDLSAG